jgi:hypothetical protein
MADRTNSRLLRAAAVAAMLMALGSAALAAQAPDLPASAKKLSAAQIASLYDGHTFTFTTYTAFGVATGTVTYDFASKTNRGKYKLGFHTGDIDGKIRMDGDKFCYKVRMDSEHCDFVYLAGKDIYDVDPSGSVRSVNRRQ